MTIPLENQLNTVLTSVFGNEIYPISHPDIIGDVDSVTNMFAVWSIVGGQSFNKLDGDSDMSRPRVQVSIYSNDYTEMKAAQRSTDVAMQAANLLASQSVDAHTDSFEVVGAISNVSVGVAQEGREDDTRRFFCHNEYYCWSRQ
jgi:hypothetical protein